MMLAIVDLVGSSGSRSPPRDALGDVEDVAAQWLSAFDGFDDILVYLKDAEGRWLACNDAASTLLGASTRSEVVGLRDADFYPSYIAERSATDDLAVLRTGVPLRNRQETVLAGGNSLVAVETTKVALRDPRQRITCLAGVTRVRGTLAGAQVGSARIARVVSHIHAHVGDSLNVPALARVACLSESQLRREFKRTVGVTPQQLVTQIRLQNAVKLLRSTREPIANIAVDSGFCDQSHFTTTFSRTFGTSPAAYRLSCSDPTARTG